MQSNVAKRHNSQQDGEKALKAQNRSSCGESCVGLGGLAMTTLGKQGIACKLWASLQQKTHSVTDLQYLLFELCCAPMETPIMVSVNVYKTTISIKWPSLLRRSVYSPQIMSNVQAVMMGTMSTTVQLEHFRLATSRSRSIRTRDCSLKTGTKSWRILKWKAGTSNFLLVRHLVPSEVSSPVPNQG